MFSYIPVLVKATLALLADVFSPDGLEGTQAPGGFYVPHNANSNKGRAFNDSDCFQNLLLVYLGARAIGLTDDVGHTRFEAQETSEMNGLGRVVLGEGLDLAAVASRTLLGVEPHGPMSGCRKFTVGLKQIQRFITKSSLNSYVFEHYNSFDDKQM